MYINVFLKPTSNYLLLFLTYYYHTTLYKSIHKHEYLKIQFTTIMLSCTKSKVIRYDQPGVSVYFLKCSFKYKEFNWKPNLDAWQAYTSAYNVCNVPQIGVDTGNDQGHAVAQLVEALHNKLEGHGCDSRWCHWNFSSTQSFQLHYGPGVDSASNRNEYQEYFLGVKAAGV